MSVLKRSLVKSQGPVGGIVAPACALAGTILGVCLCLLLGCSAIGGGGGTGTRPDIQSGSSYVPPRPEEWVMPNGIRVMYLHDPELPLVRGWLLIPTGTLWEPADRWGVVGALGSQLRQGGAGSMSADQLDRKLEELSAGVSSNAGGESLSVSFQCLSSDFETVIGLFADVVRRPRFEESRLDLWKGQNLEGIRRRVDEPSTVAGLALGELLYGWAPYGRYLLEDDVRRISRDDLMSMHTSSVIPDGAILTVIGAVDRDEIEKLLSRYFGDWRPKGVERPIPPPVEATPTPGIYFLRLPFVQSTIYLGQLGVPRLTDDYIEIEGFNELFGASGFGSFLMQRIRTELGLAYSVYGGIIPGPVQGRNIIALQTKAESSGTAIVESLRVLDSMQREVVTEEKLGEAKRSIANSFIFRFDTLDDALNRRALQEYLGYPEDYDATYLPKIAALTPEAIRRTAKRRWERSKFVIVVVGDDTAYASVQRALASGAPELEGLKLREVSFDGRLKK